MNQIHLVFADGFRCELEDTPYRGLRDVILTVAQDGADALFDWCIPVNRPPVEDVAIHANGDITLYLFALDEDGDDEEFEENHVTA